MSVPTSYLTSTKNLKEILAAIQGGQAPKKFTTRFLASLGFPSPSDRLIIGVLKSLGFLDSEGTPTSRYFEYLDQGQAKAVVARALEEAYADLYQINRKAHELTNTDLRNKLKTLTQGQVSSSVLDKMVSTFKALAQHADFTVSKPVEPELPTPELATPPEPTTPPEPLSLGGLVYNIQIVLPADRDPAVYDALFKSLKEHLLR